MFPSFILDDNDVNGGNVISKLCVSSKSYIWNGVNTSESKT